MIELGNVVLVFISCIFLAFKNGVKICRQIDFLVLFVLIITDKSPPSISASVEREKIPKIPYFTHLTVVVKYVERSIKIVLILVEKNVILENVLNVLDRELCIAFVGEIVEEFLVVFLWPKLVLAVNEFVENHFRVENIIVKNLVMKEDALLVLL